MAKTPRILYRLNSTQKRAILNAQTARQHRRAWKNVAKELGIDPESIEHNSDGNSFYARAPCKKRVEEPPREDADAYDRKPTRDDDE